MGLDSNPIEYNHFRALLKYHEQPLKHTEQGLLILFGKFRDMFLRIYQHFHVRGPIWKEYAQREVLKECVA